MMKNIYPLNITRREQEVLIHLGEGLTNKEIASTLYISPYTVDSHRKNLLEKLNAKNAMHLGVVAERLGLLRVS